MKHCSYQHYSFFSRYDGGRLHVGIPGRPEGALQGPGRFTDCKRAVWISGQYSPLVLAFPAATVHQRHRVST